MIQSAEEFVRLRNSQNIEEYERAANEEAPLSVWEDVLRKHAEMKEWVVHNKTVPLQILTILSQDDDERVRFCVAQKRKLSHLLFLRLAGDNSESVRMTIARNPKAPADVLQKLAHDKDENVREIAVRKLGRDHG